MATILDSPALECLEFRNLTHDFSSLLGILEPMDINAQLANACYFKQGC